MLRTIFKGKIDDDFEGFDDGNVYKMSNGTYWVQAKYRYWYHYAYRPDAIITEDQGRYVLTVKGQSIPVRQLSYVIESNIEGDFEGWDGDKVYNLLNGQVWKQDEYIYEYVYTYQPDVVIYEIDGVCIMCVEGTKVRVRQIR